MMLGARTGAWAKTGGGGIPSGWVEVEYIESTGTQSVRLPVTISVGDAFSIAGEMCWLSTAGLGSCIFDSNNGMQFRMQLYSRSNGIAVGASNIGTNSYKGGWNTVSDVRSSFEVSTERIVNYDGTVTILPRDFTGNVSQITIFSLSNGDRGTKVRVWNLRINIRGSIAFNIVGVRNAATNEGAMCNILTGEIFRNAGTGSFVVGPDKTT